MRSTQGFSTRIVSRVHNYNTGEERRGEGEGRGGRGREAEDIKDKETVVYERESY
mgnify:CR=1 FL=1